MLEVPDTSLDSCLGPRILSPTQVKPEVIIIIIIIYKPLFTSDSGIASKKKKAQNHNYKQKHKEKQLQ